MKHTPPRNVPSACVTWSATAALVMTLSACASSAPATPEAKQSAAPVTHNCQPKESVRFSCELHDGRLLSMCASPELTDFKGPPKDNPGYAYLVVGTPQGVVQNSYPPKPHDYKQHFFKDVPTSVIPYMFVTSSKGEFFFFTEQDVNDPLGAGQWTPENLPEGWSISKNEEQRACTHVLEFDNHFAAGIPHASAWRQQERERRDAENAKAKAKQP